jgi:simple sugar transport system permease protein
MMLTGAFFAVVTDVATHNPWLGALVAIITGGLMALIHAVVSIRFLANQIISGVAINIFAGGLTVFLLNQIYGINGVTQIPTKYWLPMVNVPGLKSIPFVGPIFFQQNICVYIALLLFVVTNVFLFRTRLGLRLRAVGEHPSAADTAGINVYRIRYAAVLASGLLSGFAGAFLSIGLSGTFNPNMTEGRGFIALAAMVFGNWRPTRAFIACLLFGLGYAVYFANSQIQVPYLLLNMLPYVLTLVVLAIAGRQTAPAADGIPYVPGGE